MKKKFKLDDLKVQSFITNVDDQSQETVKGGGFDSAFCGETGASGCRPCPSEFCPSQFCATQDGPLCGGTTVFNPKTKTIIFW